MKLTVALIKERLAGALDCPQGDLPGHRIRRWTAERVSEYLRARLDAEQPLKGGSGLRERVVVLGAGGHAKVVIEILEEQEQFEIAGCVSGEPGGEVLGVPIVGDDRILPALYAEGVRKAFVAIGENRARRNAMACAAAEGFELINAVSQHSVISPRAQLGRGITVMPGAVVNVMSCIGDGAIVNTGATIDHDCDIGPWAHVAPGANLAGGVTIGEGVFLGMGSRVLPCVSVGPWTTVGAGAVVIADLPGGVTAVGVPAVVREKAGRIENQIDSCSSSGFRRE